MSLYLGENSYMNTNFELFILCLNLEKCTVETYGNYAVSVNAFENGWQNL